MALALVLCSGHLAAQKNSGKAKGSEPNAVSVEADISGMYSFLKDGEFVQITVERDVSAGARNASANGSVKVSGFISRYGDGDSDKGQFLDHFFTKGSLTGSKLTFTTKEIHGVSFEFTGTVGRGAAKSRAEDGYYVVNGTLTQEIDDSKGTSTARTREISMKLLADMDEDQKPAKR